MLGFLGTHVRTLLQLGYNKCLVLGHMCTHCSNEDADSKARRAMWCV
jgi:hypothetical protein